MDDPEPPLTRSSVEPRNEAGGATGATNPPAEGGGGWLSRFLSVIGDVLDEVRGLRRSFRRQAHAQEAFQESVEQRLEGLRVSLKRQEEPGAERETGARLSPAQLEALMRLGDAVHHLAAETAAAEVADSTQSYLEGLAMMQVRVGNLQRSFGLEPVAGAGAAFDDRLHQAVGMTGHADLADGAVVEEVRPGYKLDGRLVRPAAVVVNRRGNSSEGVE